MGRQTCYCLLGILFSTLLISYLHHTPTITHHLLKFHVSNDWISAPYWYIPSALLSFSCTRLLYSSHDDGSIFIRSFICLCCSNLLPYVWCWSCKAPLLMHSFLFFFLLVFPYLLFLVVLTLSKWPHTGFVMPSMFRVEAFPCWMV